MKIVIEVSSGVVQAVYSEGPIPAALDVIIVDLDSGYDDSAVTGESFQIEPLSDATDGVKHALCEHDWETIRSFGATVGHDAKCRKCGLETTFTPKDDQ